MGRSLCTFPDRPHQEPDLELATAWLSGQIAAEIAARGRSQQRAAEVLGAV